MSSVKIIYKEPEDRPIEKVEWEYADEQSSAWWTTDDFLHLHQDSDLITVRSEDALEWARAILKMVEQRHG